MEFASLDELEAGFADRLKPDALFLTRALLGAAPDELYVGAPVHIDIETAGGERALSVEGVVAWSYPAAPRTPPGREAGAGIVIRKHADDDSQRRAERMLKRPGAGSRVRIPGTRLVVPRPPLRTAVVARPVTIPPTPAVRAPAAADVASSSSPFSRASVGGAGAPAAPGPAASQTAWPSAAGAADAVTPALPSSLLEPPVSVAAPPTHHVDDATGELVVPMPPAPQPRLMAMGMFVDQSFDPTPTPRPLPVEESTAAPASTSSSTPPISALPFAGLLGIAPDVSTADAPQPPPVVAVDELAASADNTADSAPRPISIDGLPDDAAPAPAAFEQRSTDVDLLQSLDDADFFPAELEEQRERVKREQLLARTRTPPVAELELTPPSANPALVEETVTSWNQLEDLPSADGDAELIADDEVQEALPALHPAPTAPPVDDNTGNHDTHDGNSLNSLPSLDPVDLRTAEQTAINLEPPEHTTAESAAISRSADVAADVPAPRPLPALEPFDPVAPPAAGDIGLAFLYSPRRGTEPISSLEAFQWPKHGTKRWNAVDAAREDGSEAALDAAVTSSPWLSRDASASASAFETGHTDPGVRVQDIVTKAVSLAAEEDDSVFSDTGAQVRPAMASPASAPGGGVDDSDTLVGETTVDETFAGRGDAGIVDDEAETDRDMKRPPTKGAGVERLGVLQRFLGGRRQ